MDFGVICALLLLNATVGFVQEYQAGSIVDELKKTLALKAVVLRDGRLREIEAPEVVPGDILQIEDVSIRSNNLRTSLVKLMFYRVLLSRQTVESSPMMPSFRSISPPLPENPLLSINTRVILATPLRLSNVERPLWLLALPVIVRS